MIVIVITFLFQFFLSSAETQVTVISVLLLSFASGVEGRVPIIKKNTKQNLLQG